MIKFIKTLLKSFLCWIILIFIFESATYFLMEDNKYSESYFISGLFITFSGIFIFYYYFKKAYFSDKVSNPFSLSSPAVLIKQGANFDLADYAEQVPEDIDDKYDSSLRKYLILYFFSVTLLYLFFMTLFVFLHPDSLLGFVFVIAVPTFYVFYILFPLLFFIGIFWIRKTNFSTIVTVFSIQLLFGLYFTFINQDLFNYILLSFVSILIIFRIIWKRKITKKESYILILISILLILLNHIGFLSPIRDFYNI